MDNEMLAALKALLDERDERLSQMMDAKLDAKLKPIQVDIAGIKEDVSVLKEDVGILKANQEYALRWTDKIEQRLNPVADYFETMNELMTLKSNRQKK